MIKYGKKQLDNGVTIYWLIFLFGLFDFSFYVDNNKRKVYWVFLTFPFFCLNYGFRWGWWVKRRGQYD